MASKKEAGKMVDLNDDKSKGPHNLLVGKAEQALESSYPPSHHIDLNFLRRIGGC